MSETSNHYQIGAVALTVTSRLPAAVRDYDRLYRWFRTADPAPEAVGLEVRAERPAPWARREYSVVCNEQVYHAGPRLSAVLPELEAAINHQVVLRRREFLLFHAGVMARDRRAVVFAGESGTGKTTLAAALLARGWRYLSDEFALVDPHSLIVHPFPKALSIKNSGLAMIREFGLAVPRGRNFTWRSRTPLVYLNPAEWRPDCLGDPCAIQYILFLSRRGDVPPGLKALSSAAAALTLYRLALNTLDLRTQGFEAAVALAARKKCLEFNLGTAEYNCELLESLLAGEVRATEPCGQPA